MCVWIWNCQYVCSDLKRSICVYEFEAGGMCVNLKQSECVYGYETEFVYELNHHHMCMDVLVFVYKLVYGYTIGQ